jgi:anti-sigma B factor antagonist
MTPAMPLSVQDNVQDDCHTLTLVGELDVATAPGLQATIDQLCEEGAREIVLDLHELSFIDSAGLRVILTSRRLCERQGSDFSLTRAQPHAQRLFELTSVIGRLSFRGRALAKRIARRQRSATRMSVARFRPDFEASLDLNLDAPRSARNYVRDLVRADASAGLREAVMLLTSELVTPIVQQGTSAFLEAGELRVWLRDDVVRVELEVASELLLPPRELSAPQYDEILLDRLAGRWSIDTGGTTACVWFELDRHQSADRCSPDRASAPKNADPTGAWPDATE